MRGEPSTRLPPSQGLCSPSDCLMDRLVVQGAKVSDYPPAGRVILVLVLVAYLDPSCLTDHSPADHAPLPVVQPPSTLVRLGVPHPSDSTGQSGGQTHSRAWNCVFPGFRLLPGLHLPGMCWNVRPPASTVSCTHQ